MHPSQQTGWDGRYFVTLLGPDGRVRRQDAVLLVPPGWAVAAVDNGMGPRPVVLPPLSTRTAR
jgi:hypothetical protein